MLHEFGPRIPSVPRPQSQKTGQLSRGTSDPKWTSTNQPARTGLVLNRLSETASHRFFPDAMEVVPPGLLFVLSTLFFKSPCLFFVHHRRHMRDCLSLQIAQKLSFFFPDEMTNPTLAVSVVLSASFVCFVLAGAALLTRFVRRASEARLRNRAGASALPRSTIALRLAHDDGE